MKSFIGTYRKNRSINIKIDKHDTWSMDNTLAYIILPMLVQLRDTANGVPSEFSNVGGADWEQQQCFDFYQESHDWAFNKKIKEWDIILDKMIWSFEQLVFENKNDYHYGEFKFSFEKTKNKAHNPLTNKSEELSELVDLNPQGHYYDHHGALLYDQRIQEGLELFGKYYRNLWD